MRPQDDSEKKMALACGGASSHQYVLRLIQAAFGACGMGGVITDTHNLTLRAVGLLVEGKVSGFALDPEAILSGGCDESLVMAARMVIYDDGVPTRDKAFTSAMARVALFHEQHN